MASAVARAYNGGLVAEPQRGPGAEALVRGSTFGFWTFNGSRKFAHFSKIWKGKEIRYLCYLCKKSWVATKLGGWSKTGGLCPPPRA